MANKGGRPKNPPKPKKMLKEIMPVDQIFDEEELALYNSLVDVYMADFDQNDLTSADIDDIMGLAINKVLEMRLLKSSKGDAEKHIDVSNAMEKLRKQTEKMKENLSARRRDRVDPNKYKGFSIVNLAVAFDDKRKEELISKRKKQKARQKEVLAKREGYTGNQFDNDVKEKDEVEYD
jgi:hypothetical protein